MNENPSKSYFSFGSRFRKQNIFSCVCLCWKKFCQHWLIFQYLFYTRLQQAIKEEKNDFKDAFGSKVESMKTYRCSESFISLD